MADEGYVDGSMLAARERGLRRGSERQSKDLTRQMPSVPDLTQDELFALATSSLKEALCLAEGAGDEDPRSHDHWYRRDSWPISDGRYWDYRGHTVGGGYTRSQYYDDRMQSDVGNVIAWRRCVADRSSHARTDIRAKRQMLASAMDLAELICSAAARSSWDRPVEKLSNSSPMQSLSQLQVAVQSQTYILTNAAWIILPSIGLQRWPRFNEGDAVVVMGLVTAVQYNGRAAVVTQRFCDERLALRLQDGMMLKIRVANVRHSSADFSAALHLNMCWRAGGRYVVVDASPGIMASAKGGSDEYSLSCFILDEMVVGEASQSAVIFAASIGNSFESCDYAMFDALCDEEALVLNRLLAAHTKVFSNTAPTLHSKEFVSLTWGAHDAEASLGSAMPPPRTLNLMTKVHLADPRFPHRMPNSGCCWCGQLLLRGTGKTCSQCGVRRFCGTTCLEESWSKGILSHRPECKSYAKQIRDQSEMSAKGLLDTSYELLQGSDMLHSLCGDRAEQLLLAQVVVALGAKDVESGIEDVYAAIASSGLPHERAMQIGTMAMELVQSLNGADMSTRDVRVARMARSFGTDPRPFAEVYGSDGAEQRRKLRNIRRARHRRSSQRQQDME